MLFSLLSSPKEYPIKKRLDKIKLEIEKIEKCYSETSEYNKHIEAYLHSAEYILEKLNKNIKDGCFENDLNNNSVFLLS